MSSSDTLLHQRDDPQNLVFRLMVETQRFARRRRARWGSWTVRGPSPFGTSNPRLKGGGPHYITDAHTGALISKRYEQ